MAPRLCALVLILTATTAQAQQPRAAAALSWDAAPGCVQARDLMQAIEAHLGRKVFVQQKAPADVVVRGTIGPRPGGGWLSALTLSREDGTEIGKRELVLERGECSALTDGLALAVALMIDLPLREATLRLPARPKPAMLSPARPAPTQEATWNSALSTGASVYFGWLPGAALTPFARVQAGSRRFVSFGLQADAIVPATRRVDGDRGTTVWGWGLGPWTCPSISRSPSVRTSACWGLHFGRLAVQGVGLDVAARAHPWFLNARAQLRLEATIAGAWNIGAAGTLGVPLLRQRFEYTRGDETRVLYKQPVVFGGGEVYVSVRWPP